MKYLVFIGFMSILVLAIESLRSLKLRFKGMVGDFFYFTIDLSSSSSTETLDKDLEKLDLSSTNSSGSTLILLGV